MSGASLSTLAATAAAGGSSPLATAAEFIRAAKYVVVTAGAGMSVDSGLPDFRGPEGFWRAYPPFQKLGYRFEEMSNPQWFRKDPKVAWGFFGHRLQLYAATVPHRGYHILRSWGERFDKKLFVFTSNVDGAFEKVGFDSASELVECHGTGTRLQCTDGDCAERHGAYPAPTDLGIRIDMERIEAHPDDMPRCPHCGALARPNILMFGDGTCDLSTVAQQELNFMEFLRVAKADDAVRQQAGGLVVLEFGAGKFVPTIRHTSEETADAVPGARFIRVNLREADIPSSVSAPSVGLSMGALEALTALDALLEAEVRHCTTPTGES